MSTLNIAVGQLNFLVGGIQVNSEKIITSIHEAKKQQSDLIIFPELALCGYPPEDLLLNTDFKKQIQQALLFIAKETADIAVILGHPDYTLQGIYNAASFIHNKKIISVYHKQCLPNYGVFDERRYFLPGTKDGLIEIKGITLGILICEDLWNPEPILSLKQAGAKCVVCINASPFDNKKAYERERAIKININETQLPVLYVHAVSGQDDLIFDGGSQFFNTQAQICATAGFFEEKLWYLHLDLPALSRSNALSNSQTDLIPSAKKTQNLKSIYAALVLGVRDYVNKNHFPGVLLGLSGGIDSALVLAIAVDALGKERVHAFTLPSRFTAKLSLDIAYDLCERLNVVLTNLSIEESFRAFLITLGFDPDQPPSGITIENIQARCRSTLLMAHSNQTGHLLLNTTNKSELAMGYGTLYGDMAGGFAVLKDVYKTQVYQLANYRNHSNEIFSEKLLKRVPSAELAIDQRDEDTLPPYHLLDSILYLYIEKAQNLEEIVKEGFDKKTAEKIIKLVDKNEYKRRQIAVGPRVSTRAFARERRYPITSGFVNTTNF